MHVISADTTVADTIRYDTPSIGSDTIPDPIIVCSLVTTVSYYNDGFYLLNSYTSECSVYPGNVHELIFFEGDKRDG